MRILVTGGAGFIGSHVADAFVAQGHEVIVVDDLSRGVVTNVPNGVAFYECDIRDERMQSIFDDVKPEVVSHHAAQISVQASLDKPMFDASVNVVGSVNVLECARLAGVRKFLYASTGGALYGEPRYLPCDEDHPIAPLSQYGTTKFFVEMYVRLYHKLYGMDYTILRYPNVYGPRQDPFGEAGVVSIYIGQMLEDQPVTIYGDGDQKRDFVYVRDIARASVAALTNASGASINLGTRVGVKVNDLFHALAKITKYDHPPSYAPSRVGDVYQIALSNSRAKELLDWSPIVSLDKGLEETVAEHLRSSPEGINEFSLRSCE